MDFFKDFCREFEEVKYKAVVSNNDLAQFQIFALIQYFSSYKKRSLFITHFIKTTWSLKPSLLLGILITFVNTFCFIYLYNKL
jgi:hypothetical protein